MVARLRREGLFVVTDRAVGGAVGAVGRHRVGYANSDPAFEQGLGHGPTSLSNAWDGISLIESGDSHHLQEGCW